MFKAIGGPVGQGGDEVSVARFVADQRTMHQVPHVFCCRILDLSVSWFYKWLGREPTDRQVRRGELEPVSEPRTSSSRLLVSHQRVATTIG
jgi:putative transposase